MNTIKQQNQALEIPIQDIKSTQRRRIQDTCEIDPSLHLAIDQIETLQKIKLNNLKKITGGEIYTTNFLNDISPVQQLGRYKNFVGASSNIAKFIKSLRKPIRMKFIKEDDVKNLGINKDVEKLQADIKNKLTEITKFNIKTTLTPLIDHHIKNKDRDRKFLINKTQEVVQYQQERLPIQLNFDQEQQTQRFSEQTSLPQSLTEMQQQQNNGNSLSLRNSIPEYITNQIFSRIHSKNLNQINGFLKPHQLSKKLRSISLPRPVNQNTEQHDYKDKILSYLPLQLIANTTKIKKTIPLNEKLHYDEIYIQQNNPIVEKQFEIQSFQETQKTGSLLLH